MKNDQAPITIRKNISAQPYTKLAGPITAADAPADSDPLGFDGPRVSSQVSGIGYQVPGAGTPDTRPLAPDTQEAVLSDPRQPLAQNGTAESVAPLAAPPKPTITLTTTVQHRGRRITITASDMTADQFCDLLDRRGFQPPDEPREWQTLPDGTPICPKHRVPMRLREKQGDHWHSHSVEGPDGRPCYCKGYAGKDSPGYEK